MVDVNTQVRLIGRDEFLKYIHGKMDMLYISYDQKFDFDVAEGIGNYILKYYDKMDIGQLDGAFKRGLEGEFDNYQKITFKLVIRWIVKVNSERQQKAADTELKNESLPMHMRIRNLVWAAMDYKKEHPGELEERAPYFCAYMAGKVNIGE